MKGGNLVQKLEAYKKDIEEYAHQYSGYTKELGSINSAISAALSSPNHSYTRSDGSTGYRDFPSVNIEPIEAAVEELVITLGGLVYQNDFNEDVPLEFSSVQFADHIDNLAKQENNPQFFEYLIMRIRTMLADTYIHKVVGEDPSISLSQWLEKYIGR